MKNLSPVIAILIIASLIISSCSQVEPVRIYPIPDKIEMMKGSFSLSPEIQFISEGIVDEEFIKTYLFQKLTIHAGINILDSDKGRNMIILRNSADFIPLTDGAYTLNIGKDSIVIESSSESGLLYGIQSLLQLVKKDRSKAFIQMAKISDHPVFQWRGMHLDVSRHFYPTEFIKKYIDILALHKMNVFHWHLVDDQGWRIQIDAYPRLTEVGAWRVNQPGEWNYEHVIGNIPDEEIYGGFYTKDEVREIVEYASQRHITIVPEIEMPGHSEAAMTAYPQFSCSKKPFKKDPDLSFEFTDPFCAGNDSVFVFLKDVLDEVLELFPSEYIHIGGDEAKKTPWDNCKLCKKRMKDEKLSDSHELQAWFISEIDSYLSSKGRKTIGWDEIMEGNLKGDAAIMAWRTAEEAEEALDKGFKTVFATSSYYYISSSQDLLTDSPARILDLETVYNYQPISLDLSDEKRNLVLGLNGCMWSENLKTEAQVLNKLLPRLAAIAETAWSNPENKNYQDFIHFLPSYFNFLDNEGIDYYVKSPSGQTNDKFFGEKYEISINTDVPGAQIRYSLDGSEPDMNSELYQSPFNISEGKTLKFVNILPSGKSSPVKTAIIEKIELNKAINIDNPQEGILMKHLECDLTSLDALPSDTLIAGVKVENLQIPSNLAGLDAFALTFEGILNLNEDGIYTFYTSSDDGSRIFINEKLIADNDGVHALLTASTKIGLQKGFHKFRLEFFEARYGEELLVEIEGPGIERQELKQNFFFSK